MVYFDSLAEATPPEIVEWHQRLEAQWRAARAAPLRLRCNTHARQRTDTECGMFALYVIVSIVRGEWQQAASAAAAAPTCATPDRVPAMIDQLLDARTPFTDEQVARFRRVFFRKREPTEKDAEPVEEAAAAEGEEAKGEKKKGGGEEEGGQQEGEQQEQQGGWWPFG